MAPKGLAMRRVTYDFSAMAETERFVRSRFPDLRGAAAHCYFLGLQTLERIKGVGVGGAVLASLDEWAKNAYVNRRTARAALAKLAGMGLVEFKVGESKRGVASKTRRRLPEEIATLVPPEVLDRHAPPDAVALAKDLQELGTPWGGMTVRPRFEAKRTGRIYMSAPALQQKPRQEIVSNLRACLAPGESLVHADYSQGEPTILMWALRRHGMFQGEREPNDVYNDLASLLSIPRGDAKAKLLQVFYSAAPVAAVPEPWGIPPDHYLRRLVGAVDEYRRRLWEGGRPRGRTGRHVHTLLGRCIASSPGTGRVHRGTVLSWHVQGTLADIFNAKLKALLALHRAGSLRFLLQQHDGVYVACPTLGLPSAAPSEGVGYGGSGFLVKDVMEKDMPLEGLSLKVVTTVL